MPYPSPVRPRPRILVVDDDPLVLRCLSRMLKRHFDVVTASGGRRALEILDRRMVDAIVCDLSMPDVDGAAVVEALPEVAPYLVDCAVLCHGGITNDRHRDFLAQVPCMVVEKPIRPEALVQAIHDAIRRRAA